MATAVSQPEKAQRRKTDRKRDDGSPLKALRMAQGLSIRELAKKAGLHRNTLGKLENGYTREVSGATASALSAALKVRPSELGVKIRDGETAPSVRFRQLPRELRDIVADVISVAPEDYDVIRNALEEIRSRRARDHGKGANR
jgi:transcriptional regulator with XRE-family HTH domain